MEVCVESVESAVSAAKGGAIRIELCSALSEGGLTPSCGLLKVIKSSVNIPVFVMLRPRCGNFVYSDLDMEAIKFDAKLLLDAGADGFVFGALTQEGNVDIKSCKGLLEIIKHKPVTFHRAFDWTLNPVESLEQIIELGFHRILTSGLQDTVVNGLKVLQDLIERSAGRIIILPGAGINIDNIKRVIESTKVKEFHASARVSVSVGAVHRNVRCSMGTQDAEVKVTCTETVQKMMQVYRKVHGLKTGENY